MNNLIEKLQEEINRRSVSTIEPHRYYSVLIPLIKRNDNIEVLFEKRSVDLKIQPGEICFPGGRIEEGEDAISAAKRETFEEIGIEESEIQILGEIDTLMHHSKISIFPIVAYIGERELGDLKLNKAEVEKVFTIPLDWFKEKKPDIHYVGLKITEEDDFPYKKIGFKDGYNWRKGRFKVPIWEYKDRGEDIVLWGMTAMMTMNLVEILEKI